MRKERLIKEKEGCVKGMPWWIRLTVEELNLFSCGQLKVLKEIMEKAEKYRETCNPFYILSANEIVQKSSGKIGYFTPDGHVTEVSEDEIMCGASLQVYKQFKELSKQKEA